MMQYIIQEGVQGICPPGCHLPTDNEWKVLEGAVDSYCGIIDNIWDNLGYRGYNAGTNLKATSGWYTNGNGTDLFGFSDMSGGDCMDVGYFLDVVVCGIWWTSTEYNILNSWYRYLDYDLPIVYHHRTYKEDGSSVSCLRD